MQKYAYVSLLYLNNKGECSYLDGALLTGLGLRKQKVQYKLICMVTPDVSNNIHQILKIVYDEIIIVDYISPFDNIGIKITSDIFEPNVLKTEMSKVFTKLHIFDKNKFPYDKIIFIDNDLIPLKDYDSLFELDTPAGWPEHILENNTKNGKYYTRIWDIWKDINHGEIIPNEITDVYKIPGTDINAGLMVIKPDIDIFNFFINQLQKPKKEWLGKDFLQKGTINIKKEYSEYILEQSYLTQHFSGQWKMINGKYCSWGMKKDIDIYGVHMAGLKYDINGKWLNLKTWMIQIPLDDGMNEITNKIVLWGIKEYPELKSIIFKDLKIYIYGKLIKLKNLNKLDYSLLNKYQKNIVNELS